jgi:hypothetical protein
MLRQHFAPRGGPGMCDFAADTHATWHMHVAIVNFYMHALLPEAALACVTLQQTHMLHGTCMLQLSTFICMPMLNSATRLAADVTANTAPWNRNYMQKVCTTKETTMWSMQQT